VGVNSEKADLIRCLAVVCLNQQADVLVCLAWDRPIRSASELGVHLVAVYGEIHPFPLAKVKLGASDDFYLGAEVGLFGFCEFFQIESPRPLPIEYLVDGLP
jgi:hypothetical protein